MKHCVACDKSQEAYRKRLAEFEAKYPNYCQKCSGLGSIYYQDDPSPAGVGLSAGTMDFDDPCPECVEEGKCPLCGGQTEFSDPDDRDICPTCGWKYLMTSDEIRKAPQAPEQPDCDCFEQYASDLEDTNTSETPCQVCGGSMEVNDRDAAHGFEVESLRSSDYYRAMVDALLQSVDLDTIIQSLRMACVPDSYNIVDRFARHHLYANEDYQRINRAIQTLREAQSAFEQEIIAQITPAVDETIEDTRNEWMILEDDPDAENFREHVVDAGRNGYGYPWRPFDTDVRNEYIYDQITDQGDLQQNVAGIQMGNMDDLIARVTEELSGE